MTTKIIMYNSKTGACTLTQAKPEGPVYKKMLADGFTAIGKCHGFNATASSLTAVERKNLNAK